jgi:hypothetical protein
MVRRLTVLALLVVALGACAAPEYTSSSASRDMQRAGLTRTQADCVLGALRSHYSQEYVDAQRNALIARGLDPNSAAINPKEVDLYVRNKLAGQDKIGNDEAALARQITTTCRSKP